MGKVFEVEFELMNKEELQWLADQAALHSAIANIGCWTGASVKTLAQNTPGLVYAVDPWLDPATIYPEETMKYMTSDWIYLTYLENMKDCYNCFSFRTTSLEAAKALQYIKLDMVFIDARHEYEFVKEDILAWKPLLVEGGLLCGHDYEPGAPWGVGVVKAVDELLPGRTLTKAGTIWEITV